MPIVADATVFRYLVIVDATAILPALFGTVLVPPAVVRELQHASTPARVRAWWRTVPSWVHIQAPHLPPDPALYSLGEGEQEAIRLMDEQQAPLLMTDDRDAYNAAVARGIAVTRTLRVLEIAAEQDLLDFPTIVARLRAAGFYMPEDVVDEMLARDAARKVAAQEHPPDTQET
jgi:predicted nucleic acid-binding protein